MYTYIPSLWRLSLTSPMPPARSSQRTELGSLCYTAASHQLSILCMVVYVESFLGSSVGKESTCNAGDPGLIPGLGRVRLPTPVFLGFPVGSDGKESSCNVGDLILILASGRSPGGGHGNPLQYSCLENPHGQRSLAGYSPWGHTTEVPKHSTVYVEHELSITLG